MQTVQAIELTGHLRVPQRCAPAALGNLAWSAPTGVEREPFRADVRSIPLVLPLPLMLLLDDDDELPDSPDEHEAALVANLGSAGLFAIDDALQHNAQKSWLKASRVVVDALESAGFPIADDSYIDLHVRRLIGLVDRGLLEARGNLRRPRFSEVRLHERAPSRV